jgi:hypothetical protein
MAGAALAAIPGIISSIGAAAVANPAITGALLGGLTNRDDPLKGAVLGGLTGGLTGAGMAANTAAAGKTAAAQSALNRGVAEGAKSALAQQGAVNLANTAVNPLMSGQIATDAARQFAQAGGQMSLTPTATSALTSAGTMSPAASALTAPILPPEPSTLSKIGSRAISVAKDKPMETIDFLSALGGGEQQQAPAPSMAPLTQPGGFGNVPTIEESIAMDGGPRFVSKGLFDESKRSMEEEEMALMYQKLSEAGLV